MMRKRFENMAGKHRGSERGSGLVELALTMPVLIILLLGAAEFARLDYASIEVTNAAKAGAQYGGLSSSNASNGPGIQAAVSNDASNLTGVTATSSTAGICSSGAACTGSGGKCLSTDCSTAGDHIEEVLTVTTQVTYNPTIHIPGFATTYTLSGRATQKVLPQ